MLEPVAPPDDWRAHPDGPWEGLLQHVMAKMDEKIAAFRGEFAPSPEPPARPEGPGADIGVGTAPADDSGGSAT